jgi:hypothetical protein
MVLSMFDTETMAELYVKQGLPEQALQIYRRLRATAYDDEARARIESRIDELLDRTPEKAPESESPELHVETAGNEIRIDWRLPSALATPALQLLILRRTARGIETDPRTIPLTTPRGHTMVQAPNLHSVRAAAGRLDGGTFVPIVRLGAPGVV